MDGVWKQNFPNKKNNVLYLAQELNNRNSYFPFPSVEQTK